MTRLIGDMISDYGPIVLTLAIVLVASIITVGNFENRRW